MQLPAIQIQRVRQDFARLESQPAAVAGLFYGYLFSAHPELRPMFRGVGTEQGLKLMQMLAAAVTLLDQPAHLKPILQRLGRRHRGYGAEDWHYSAFAEALFKTLSQCLGDGFDSTQRQAWSQAYAYISHTMQQADRHAAVC